MCRIAVRQASGHGAGQRPNRNEPSRPCLQPETGSLCRRHSCAGDGDERMRGASLFDSSGRANISSGPTRVLTQPPPQSSQSETHSVGPLRGNPAHLRSARAMTAQRSKGLIQPTIVPEIGLNRSALSARRRHRPNSPEDQSTVRQKSRRDLTQRAAAVFQAGPWRCPARALPRGRSSAASPRRLQEQSTVIRPAFQPGRGQPAS